MTQPLTSVMLTVLLAGSTSPLSISLAEVTDAPSLQGQQAAKPDLHDSETATAPVSSKEENDADGLVNLLNDVRGAVRAFPESIDERLDLADVLFRIGDLDQAIDEAKTAVALSGDSAPAHLQLGRLYAAKQDWKHALAELQEAARLNPDSAQVQYQLGAVYYGLRNLKTAIQAYQTALDLQPYFPDARYHLGLLLKLAHRDKDAVTLFEEAAEGGVARAQLFTGNAYRYGEGVEKDLARAILWWQRAGENGVAQARESLARMRRQALAPGRENRQIQEARDAFARYRERLWTEYPDAIKSGPDQSLGATLLMDNQTANGVSALIMEAYALSEVAIDELARLYADGLDVRLKPFDRRILVCLETTAADGFPPAKKELARIYGRGLGVPQNPEKAKAALKGLPKEEVTSILEEVTGR